MFIPKAVHTGKKIGVKINVAGVISMNVPTTNKIMLIINKMTYLLLEIDNNAEYSSTLIKLLDTTLEINSFVGDENFEHYKDNLDESLLRKLQEFRRNNSEELATQIRKYYAKK